MSRQEGSTKACTLDRFATVLVITVLLTSLASALAVPVAADPLGGCQPQALTHPLWVEEVTLTLVSGAQDSVVTENGAAFVAPGDVVRAELLVLNRVEPACQYLQMRDTTLVTGELSYPAAGLVEERMDGRCWELYAGERCASLTYDLEVAPGAGEQVLRFVVGSNGGSAFGAIAGAERVLVVEAKPDLALDAFDWRDPADPAERHTVYGGHGSSSFDLTITNAGTYPAWNPNGGDWYWGRSAFDAPGDGDEAPDHRVAGHGTEARYRSTGAELPPCIPDDAGPSSMSVAAWGEHLVCSYRRGAALDAPIHYTVTPLGAGEPVEEGVDGTLTDNELLMEGDKDDALAHAANEAGASNALELVLHAFDRVRRAGTYELAVALDQDVDGVGLTPELDESNNAGALTATILGADLRLDTVTISVPAAAGCGEDGSAACPTGSVVALTASVINAGDPEVDGNDHVLGHAWRAAVYLNGQIARDLNGDPAIVEVPAVPNTTDPAIDLWATPLHIATSAAGGLQGIEVRLDHPDNYANDLLPILDDQGRIAERFDDGACPDQGALLDNTFCTSLDFVAKDGVTPPLPDLGIVRVELAKRILSTDLLQAVVQPWAGQDIDFRVANLGPGAAEASTVDLWACGEEAEGPTPFERAGCELVDVWALGPLQPGEHVNLDTRWSTWGKLGDFELCATVHYDGEETTDANNVECIDTYVLVGNSGLGGSRVG